MSFLRVVAILGEEALTQASVRIGGQSLAAYIREQGPLSPNEATRFTLTIAAQLSFAAKKGCAVGNLNCDNIYLNRETRGIVEPVIVSNRYSTRHTAYLAPEQLPAVGRSSPRIDVWALGIVLYHSLTAQFPYDPCTSEELVRAILNDVLIPIRARRSDISDELVDVVNTALCRDPRVRYPDAGAMGMALAVGMNELQRWTSDLAIAERWYDSSRKTVPAPSSSGVIPIHVDVVDQEPTVVRRANIR